MSHPEFAAISFIAIVITIIPLPWHWRARNIATLSTIFWLAVGNLHHFVGAIGWAGSVRPKWRVWCDISTFFFVATAFGLPAGALCITRHLESVASTRYSTSGLNDRRRRLIFEISMCVVVPITLAGLHLIVQGHRFDIIEDIGCMPATYISWAAIFLVYFPPILMSLITTIYAGLALRWFMQRRAQFQALLSSSNSGLTTARYLRLMGLALCEMLAVFGLSCYTVVSAFREHALLPWVSWDYVHSNFDRIAQYPLVLVPPSLLRTLIGCWYIVPFGSLCFFAFFGFGEEALAEYRRWGRWIARNVFRREVSDQTPLPSFVGSQNRSVTRVVEMSKIGTNTTISDTDSKWDDDVEVGTDQDSCTTQR